MFSFFFIFFSFLLFSSFSFFVLHFSSLFFIFLLFFFMFSSFSFMFFHFLCLCWVARNPIFWASIASRFLETLKKFSSRLGRYLFGPSLFLFFSLVYLLFLKKSFFLFYLLIFLFSFFRKKKVSSFLFLVFLSNLFYCWHQYQSLTVSSVVGAPWRCGVLTT